MPHACFCLFLYVINDDNVMIDNQTYLSIIGCVAGLSPKGVGREKRLDDMLFQMNENRVYPSFSFLTIEEDTIDVYHRNKEG